MPWRPKCRTEYVPERKTCAGCRTPLVESLPETGGSAGSHESEDPGGWVLLANVGSSQEADLVASRLKADGIPVMKQPRGAGQYMEILMGNAIDVDLYVPEACLAGARSLLPGGGAPNPGGGAPNPGSGDTNPGSGDTNPGGGANKQAAAMPPLAVAPAAVNNTGRNLLIALLLAPILIYMCVVVYSALAGIWRSLF